MSTPVPARPKRSKIIYLLLAALPIVVGLVLLNHFRERDAPLEKGAGAVASHDLKLEELPSGEPPTVEAANSAEEDGTEAYLAEMRSLMKWLNYQPGVAFRARQLLAGFASQAEADAWAKRLEDMGFRVLDRVNLAGGGAILKLGYSNPSLLDKLAGLLKEGEAPPFDLGLNYLYGTPANSSQARTDGINGTTPSGAETLALMGAHPQADWGLGVKVAVLDDGIFAHEVFGANVPGLVDLLGADVVSSGAHGTAMASLITGDMLGTIGVAPGSDVTMYRVLGSDGVGDAFSVAQGIYAAVADGAQFINLSLGGAGDSAFLRAAVEYAYNQGVALVPAAGNGGNVGLTYPAAYTDFVYPVGAVDATNTPTGFSNIGEGMALVTQGMGVLAGSTKPGYASVSSGTSPATALVSGAGAVVAKYYDVSPVEAMQILIDTADDYGAPGPDEIYGAGAINLERALNQNANVTDSAAVGGIVTYGNNTASPYQVTVGVQNRGTKNIGQTVVRLTANGFTDTATVNGLGAGDTGVASFNWPKSRFGNSNSVQATLNVQILGGADSVPTNDTRTIVLTKP